MNSDENNKLEKTQVIEISDEDVPVQLNTNDDSFKREDTDIIPDINELENVTSEEKFDEDALASLPDIEEFENDEETIPKMNNLEEAIIPMVDNIDEYMPEMGSVEVEVPEINEVEIDDSEMNTLEKNVKEEEKVQEVNNYYEPAPKEPRVETEETSLANEKSVNETNSTVFQEPAIEKNISSQNDDFDEKERKIWPIIVILVIAILGGLFAYYYFVLTKPINIINRLLNNSYSSVKKLANNSSSSNGDFNINSFILDSNFTVSSDAKKYTDFSGLSAKVYYALDLKDNKSKTDLTISLKDQKLINVATSIVGNRTYYDFKDAFPKVVEVDTEEEQPFDISSFIDQKELTNKTADYLYLLETVKNAILKNISEENLSKRILMKDIDGKKIPAVEVIYKIDYKEYKKLHNAVLNTIIDDSRALNILSSNYEKPEDLKNKLISKRDELSEIDFGSNVDMIIDIDAFTNNLVNLEIKDSSSKVLIRNSNTDININIIDGIVGSDENFGTMDITIDKKEKKVFVDVKIKPDEETIRIGLTLKANKLSNTVLDFNASVILYDTVDINKEVLTLAGSFKLELNKMITTINIADAININDLSKADLSKVSKEMESFTETLGTLIGAVETN